MNEKSLELIEGVVDCITIIAPEFRKLPDFRLKAKDNRIELATREGQFLPDWQGFVDIDCYPPILRLTKLNGTYINKEIKIPEPEPGIERIMIGLGRIFVTFAFHKQEKKDRS